MWCISQDGKTLGKFNQFKAISGTNKYWIIGYQGGLDGEGSILGQYESEEEALGVISAIKLKVIKMLTTGERTIDFNRIK